MSEFSKNEILLALIAAGNADAQNYALSLVTGGNDTVTVGGTLTVTPPANEKPLDIGHETDATTLDKNGLPWDSRIHAGSKTQNKDGTWKYKPGVDKDVLVPQVEAELREAGYSEPESETTTPPAAVTPPPGAPTPAATPGLPPAAPAAPGLPPVAPPVAPPAAPKIDFPDVKSEEDMDENALTQTAAALYAKHGEQAVINLLALFQVPEGGTAKDIQAGYKFPFWQYATNDDNLRLQKIID